MNIYVLYIRVMWHLIYLSTSYMKTGLRPCVSLHCCQMKLVCINIESFYWGDHVIHHLYSHTWMREVAPWSFIALCTTYLRLPTLMQDNILTHKAIRTANLIILPWDPGPGWTRRPTQGHDRRCSFIKYWPVETKLIWTLTWYILY